MGIVAISLQDLLLASGGLGLDMLDLLWVLGGGWLRGGNVGVPFASGLWCGYRSSFVWVCLLLLHQIRCYLFLRLVIRFYFYHLVGSVFFSLSFEMGTYHPSIVTGFQLINSYTWLTFWLVWIMERYREFVSLTVNAVLLSLCCLWNKAIVHLQIELFRPMFSVIDLELGLTSPLWLYASSY